LYCQFKEGHIIIEFYIVFIELVKPCLEFVTITLPPYANANTIGAKESQAVTCGCKFFKKGPVQIVRSVKHALQTYIDGPVFGGHKFYLQVLCLEVYLISRDGRSKVTPGTISNIPPGPVDFKRSPQGRLTIKDGRGVNEKGNGSLLGIEGCKFIGGGCCIGTKQPAHNLTLEKVVFRGHVHGYILLVKIDKGLQLLIGLGWHRLVESPKSCISCFLRSQPKWHH